MDILKIVENTVKKHRLIDENDRVLVALSGGSDSALLIRVLCGLSERLGFTVAAAHINHQLRDTADRDEEFCKELCRELGVELFVKKADIKTLAREAKMGEEQFARNLRYDFFASLGYDKIATAHNKNDVAETVLFNFMRGAGIKGLSGIPYKRGNIIRPLLDVKKVEVLEYSHHMGYSYVTDETNFQPVYTRNKIRLGLIPKIEEEINPSFVDVITANAAHIKEDSDYLDALSIEAYGGEVTYLMAKSLPAPVFRRVCLLHYQDTAGKDRSLSRIYIDKIIELVRKNQTGQKIHLPHNMEAKMEYGKLIIGKKAAKTAYEYPILPGIVLNVPEIGKNIRIGEAVGKGDFYLEDTTGLTLRSKRAGDVFYPVGMQGRKKLSDYFTDKKIPSAKRDMIPILCSKGEIVSVVGYRSDRRFSTGKAYRIEIMEEENAD